jgi:hypothetical protein
MTVTKTIKVGRPRIPIARKKVTFPLSIDPRYLSAIRKRAKHGKVAQWINAAIFEALHK